MSANSPGVRERIAQNDVTVGRSYLEVDTMEWLSDNEIPFGYEPFVIPSVVTVDGMDWQRMVNAIRALGNRNQSGYLDNIRGTPLEGRNPFSALALWNDIYDKHELAEESVTVPVTESLQKFDKSMVLPDFALYPDVEQKVAGEGFDWSDYSYLLEVSGLYGVGLPDESTESDWWDWYRVSAVAFKEFVYRLLDLWNELYWVVPNSNELPNALRDDDHYVIIDPVAGDLGLDPLADEIGLTQSRIAGGLSNPIELLEYQRPRTRNLPGGFDVQKWEYDSVNQKQASEVEDAVQVGENYVVFHGELGEVYLSDDGVQVRESQWGNTNLLILREYVLDVVSDLADQGLVNGLRRVA